MEDVIQRILPTTKSEVAMTLNYYGIQNYSINKDLSVNVHGDVNLSGKKLIYLPVNFLIVTGKFHCYRNKLISLEGSPREVSEFQCEFNQLTSLKGGPISATDYTCHWNFLESLEHCPKNVKTMACWNNKITTLKHLPSTLNHLFCRHNQLTELDLCSDIKKIDTLIFSHNNIKTLKDFNIDIESVINFSYNPISIDEQLYLCEDKFKSKWSLTGNTINDELQDDVFLNALKKHKTLFDNL